MLGSVGGTIFCTTSYKDSNQVSSAAATSSGLATHPAHAEHERSWSFVFILIINNLATSSPSSHMHEYVAAQLWLIRIHSSAIVFARLVFVPHNK